MNRNISFKASFTREEEGKKVLFSASWGKKKFVSAGFSIKDDHSPDEFLDVLEMMLDVLDDGIRQEKVYEMQFLYRVLKEYIGDMDIIELEEKVKDIE